MPDAPFLGPTYNNTFLPADAQRCVNWFPVGNTLKSIPGYEWWAKATTGPHRGWVHHKDELVMVSGSGVWTLSVGGFVKQVGTLDTAVGRVSMASSGWDGDEVLLVDGLKGYVYNGSNVTQVSDPEFPAQPSWALFDNGYFMVGKGQSAELYDSENAYDALAWGGSFATAEHSPDKTVTALSNKNDIWILGETSCEIWYYSGEAFPWNPNRSAFQHYGCAAPESLTTFDNNVAWLATSKEIGLLAVKTQGFAVQRISTTVIEAEWRKYGDVSDCHCWSFQYPGWGHFLVYQFPSADKTWVFEGQEGQWHEWEMHDGNPLAVGKHIGNHFAHFGGKYLIGDDYTGDIYQMSVDYDQSGGKHLVRKRMGPNLVSGRDILVHNALELVIQTGVGKLGAETPYARLSYSDDRGGVWSNWRDRSLGGVGARKQRVEFSRLGSAKERIYRIEVSNDVNAMLTNSILEVEKGFK
jgi:hypothetical protein